MKVILLLLAIGWEPSIQVDKVELNHVKDKFVQVIFWRWCLLTDGYGFHVAQWTFVKPGEYTINKRLGKDKFILRKSGITYQIWCKSLIETYTVYDPEVEDRELIPCECRRPYIKFD